MFDAHADDVGYPIDLVFSWVDGADPAFLSSRAGWLARARLGDGDGAEARTRQIDELRYALRSVDRNAPWVRRIFIATDTRLPDWLIADHPKITVVRASEHFSDPAVLPTFNSHAVESQLHHIDGLAEHFLYCNDDMFFGRPVAASVFFTPAGISRFIESPIRIGGGAAAPSRSGHENAARNNRHLLAQRFGYLIAATWRIHQSRCGAACSPNWKPSSLTSSLLPKPAGSVRQPTFRSRTRSITTTRC